MSRVSISVYFLTVLIRESVNLVWQSPSYFNHVVFRQESTQELEYLTAQAKNVTSSKYNLEEGKQSSYNDDSDSDKDSSDEDECDKTDRGEYDEIFSKIELHTQWLSQLSPALEQNLITAQNTEATHVALRSSTFLVSTPAQYYVSLVREKYKLADERLIERLGEANWQRHLNVRNSPQLSDITDEEATQILDEHPAASSVFRPFSAFHDSGIGTSVNFIEEDTRSHTSFLSTDSQSEVEVVRVPATPAEVQTGIPFKCFLCKRTLSNIKNRVQWKMHIFSDLRPYICTFSCCQDELVQFDHRSDWADHEFGKHRTRKSWNCIACSKRSTTVEEWEEHLQKVHDIHFKGQNLQAACRLALVEEERPAEQEECPLCRKIIQKSRRAFIAHVGRHMEQIALAVLPRDVDEPESDDCESSVEHSSVDEPLDNPNFVMERIPDEEAQRILKQFPPPVSHLFSRPCISCQTRHITCYRNFSRGDDDPGCEPCLIELQTCSFTATRTTKADEARQDTKLQTDPDQAIIVPKQSSEHSLQNIGDKSARDVDRVNFEDPVRTPIRRQSITLDDRCECLNCWLDKQFLHSRSRSGVRSATKPLFKDCFTGCGKKFGSRQNLESHLWKECCGKGCPHRYCPDASKIFRCWEDVVLHIVGFHCTKASDLICPVLGCKLRHFSDKEKLEEHIRKAHLNMINTTPTRKETSVGPLGISENKNDPPMKGYGTADQEQLNLDGSLHDSLDEADVSLQKGSDGSADKPPIEPRIIDVEHEIVSQSEDKPETNTPRIGD